MHHLAKTFTSYYDAFPMMHFYPYISAHRDTAWNRVNASERLMPGKPPVMCGERSAQASAFSQHSTRYRDEPKFAIGYHLCYYKSRVTIQYSRINRTSPQTG